MHSRNTATVVGGWSLIAATLLFYGVFVFLARQFGYPDVLDLPADQVLPRLLALGPTGRAVWGLYAAVPLLLLPAGLGVRAAGRQAAPGLARAALVFALLSALCMTAGLLRWPSLHWELALAHAQASPAGRETIAATFASANTWLGRVVGEFLGELFLNAFFALAALLLVRAGAGRWLLVAGGAASALGALAMLRNLSGWVAPLAEMNNAVLPLWMLVLGGAMLRRPTTAAAASAPTAGMVRAA